MTSNKPAKFPIPKLKCVFVIFNKYMVNEIYFVLFYSLLICYSTNQLNHVVEKSASHLYQITEMRMAVI